MNTKYTNNIRKKRKRKLLFEILGMPGIPENIMNTDILRNVVLPGAITGLGGGAIGYLVSKQYLDSLKRNEILTRCNPNDKNCIRKINNKYRNKLIDLTAASGLMGGLLGSAPGIAGHYMASNLNKSLDNYSNTASSYITKYKTMGNLLNSLGENPTSESIKSLAIKLGLGSAASKAIEKTLTKLVKWGPKDFRYQLIMSLPIDVMLALPQF